MAHTDEKAQTKILAAHADKSLIREKQKEMMWTFFNQLVIGDFSDVHEVVAKTLFQALHMNILLKGEETDQIPPEGLMFLLDLKNLMQSLAVLDGLAVEQTLDYGHVFQDQELIYSAQFSINQMRKSQQNKTSGAHHRSQSA